MSVRLLLAVMLLSCGSATAATPEPCAPVALATVMAGCEARIRIECQTNDKSCAVYEQCKAAVKSWRECPEVTP